MNRLSAKPRYMDKEMSLILSLVMVKLALHFATNAFTDFGIFRDELYYLACSLRPAAGYVDHPPLSIFFLTLSRSLFGDSLFALRLLPALTGGLTVLFIGLSVRRLGGKSLAILPACLAFMVSPIFLGFNTVYSMNAFDVLYWTLGGYLLLLLLEDEKPRYWLLLGLVMGLGLLNKISMAWFGAGLLLGLLATHRRKSLTRLWPYLAGLIAFGIFLPFIFWNATNQWAHLEFIDNATRLKYSSVTPLDFLVGQFKLIHPLAVPVWAAGLYYYFFSPKGRRFMILGIIFVTTLSILLVNGHSKPEYMAAAFPLLFSAGGVQLEKLAASKYFKIPLYALPVLLVVGGAVLAPMALPCLPVQDFIGYNRALGMAPITYEGKEMAQLHQFYADMFGWENMAANVSNIYRNMSPKYREKAVIFARNYGEAGAIEYYSRRYPLPAVISPHNNYWIWWGEEHEDKDYTAAILLGGRLEHYVDYFEKVKQVWTIRCRYCMPYENNLPVYIGYEPKRPLDEIRAAAKHFE